MKPNIFGLATKELSQDSFFTWLLQWADDENKVYNQELNETGKSLIRLLINQSKDYPITKVEAGRQWRNIDIWAKINNEYFIAIEDKTNTGEHSKQLERYKIIVNEHYKDTDLKLIFIYLKSGNESSATLKKVTGNGYLVVGRKAILNILNEREVQNEIFSEYKEYLTKIEDSTSSYTVFKNIVSNWKAGEGFYVKLQELLDGSSDWRYVSNRTGGFLGFWYHWTGTNEYSLYIQIENAFEKGIRLVVKIGDWIPNTNTLYQVISGLQPYAKKYGLKITKPEKFKAGAASTLGIIQNAFSVDFNGNFDFEEFILTLKKVEGTLDDYSRDRKIQPIEAALQAESYPNI